MILDDLLKDVYLTDVYDLFTKCSHHRNINAILITQNLFHHGRFSTDMSLNAKYLVVFKKVRDSFNSRIWPDNCTRVIWTRPADPTDICH